MELISIVVPTHNEELNIKILAERISKVFENINKKKLLKKINNENNHKSFKFNYELIFIDDSTDSTPFVIKDFAQKDKRIKLIKLVRSFGQSVAIAAGLKRAKGSAVIIMDADLQDPPEVIIDFLQKWKKGNKVVYAQRTSDNKFFIYAVLAYIFYRILNYISEVNIPVDSGEFRLLDRTVVDYMNNLTEHSRFIRGLTIWPGYKTAKIKIKRSKRLHGKTNYNLFHGFSNAIEGFVSFSNVPLRIIMVLGILIFIFSFLLGFIYLLFWLFNKSLFSPGYLSIFLLILFMGGINLFCIGISGEYIGRIFTELKNRPLYIVDYEIGF